MLKLALEYYYEYEATRRGFWSGVLYAAVPSLLIGVAAFIGLSYRVAAGL